MRARGCTALLSLILMSSAQAASFDCAKASSFVEKAICSDKRLSSMDDQLARLYKAARAAATNASALETEQKSWLSSRDRCTNTACLKKTYADRIAALSGPSTAPAFGSFTGTYKMQNGEALIQQTGERIKFSINATYRQNTREITGEGSADGQQRQICRSGCGLHLVVQVRGRQARHHAGRNLRDGSQRVRRRKLQAHERGGAQIRRMILAAY